MTRVELQLVKDKYEKDFDAALSRKDKAAANRIVDEWQLEMEMNRQNLNKNTITNK